MAFLRFTRDKRGYEQFSLVETATNRRGKSRSRLLYWYRTPPNVRVGREPFDEPVRRALEAQYPGVQFDWRKIVETPIPSAETERWRERRRAEKAEKAALRATSIDTEGQAEADADSEAESQEPFDAIEAEGALGAADEPAKPGVATPPPATEPTAAEARSRRRRRRRGSRGRDESSRGAPPPSAHATPLASAPESDADVQPALSDEDTGSDIEQGSGPEEE